MAIGYPPRVAPFPVGSTRCLARHLVSTTVIVISISAWSGAVDAEDPAAASLKMVVDNVRQNEGLYDNIDVAMHTEDDIGDRQTKATRPNVDPTSDEGALKITSRKSLDTKYVSQGIRFRVETDGMETTVDGLTTPNEHVRMYDGDRTRLFYQKAIGNVIAGRKEDPSAVRPHMLLLRRMGIHARLSAYLQGMTNEGGDARPDPNLSTSASYQGEAEVQGLKCHRLWITTTLHGKPHDRWELWLAEERNYIPVKMLAYTFRFSKEIPVGEGVADEWREIKPGIWFPFAVHVTAFDKATIQREGRQTLRWREQYTVARASLDPNYPDDFFKEPRFPDGTAVYEIENDKIVRGYWQGGSPPAAEPPPARWGWRWPLVALNVAVVVTLAALLAARRFRNLKGRRLTQ